MKFQITPDKVMESVCRLEFTGGRTSGLGNYLSQVPKYLEWEIIRWRIKGIWSYYKSNTVFMVFT